MRKPPPAPRPPPRSGPGEATPPRRPRLPATPTRPDSAGDAPWLWGHHAVTAALANPQRKLLRLVATADQMAEVGAAAKAAGQAIAVQELEKEALARLLPPGAVHQGVALLTRPLPAVALETILEGAASLPRAMLVVLDQVTDPHNVGAILRSAAAFGALALVVPDKHAPETAGVLAKAASGAVEQVPMVRVTNLVRALDQMKAAGFWSIGLDGAAETTLPALDPGPRVALVLGAEGDGLRRLTREHCDWLARLPTQGPIASLNVSNAAAIALYEIARRG